MSKEMQPRQPRRRYFEGATPVEHFIWDWDAGDGVRLVFSNSQEDDFIKGLVRLTASYGDASVQAKFSDEKIPDPETVKAIGDKLLDVLSSIAGDASE